MKKQLCILLVLALALSLGVGAYASGEASGATAESAGPRAIIVLGNGGEEPENEQTEGYDLTFYPEGGRDEKGIHGFILLSDASEAALLYAEPTEENGRVFTIGGDGANLPLDACPASELALEYLKDVGVEAFDSAVMLGAKGRMEVWDRTLSSRAWVSMRKRLSSWRISETMWSICSTQSRMRSRYSSSRPSPSSSRSMRMTSAMVWMAVRGDFTSWTRYWISS